jgi:hypothetical protein
LALVCGAAAALLGSVILGEYEFTGSLPFIAGPLFGLAIGELVVGVGRHRTTVVGAVSAMVCFAAITWSGWISSGHGLEPFPELVWVAAALAAVFAFVRTAGLRPDPH